jgi:hypothetical protein
MRRRLVHPLDREWRLVQTRWMVRFAIGPLDWPERLRWWRYQAASVLKPLGIAVAVVAGFLLGWMITMPSAWTLEQRILHIAAAPSCASARRVGLAPARRGEPGYYAFHDGDKDGIACEPFVRNHNVTLEALEQATLEAVTRRLLPPSHGDAQARGR